MKWFGLVMLVLMSTLCGYLHGKTSIAYRCNKDNEFNYAGQTYLCIPEDLLEDLKEKPLYRSHITI